MNKYDLRAALESFEHNVSEEERGKEEDLLTDARKQIDYITYRDRMFYNVQKIYQE